MAVYLAFLGPFSTALGVSVDRKEGEQKEKKERKRERRGRIEGRKNILSSYYVPDTILCTFILFFCIFPVLLRYN